MKKIVNGICIAMGFLCLGLGTLGIFLPVLPTTPLYLLTLVFFARGSERFHRWFSSTKLYDRYLAEFMATKSMTLFSKIKILLIAGVFEAFAFWKAPLIARIVIVVLTVMHWIYFFAFIPTRGKRISDAQAQMPAE